MKVRAALSLAVIVFLIGCKNAKKSAEKSDQQAANTEVAPAVAPSDDTEIAEEAEDQYNAPDSIAMKAAQIDRHRPYIIASMYFGMYRSACYGQCPVYNLDIDTAGRAVIEAKRFFDFEGFHETQLTPAQMQFIEDKALETGYFSFDHVYDANVTDLPSTLTILQTDSELHWVYDRLNAPKELRRFESEIDAFIRTLDWKPFDPKK